MTSAPVVRSRLPVGSSARMSEGVGASARAMATRCCSPPESCPGKCASRCDSPTSASAARAVSKASSRSRNSSGSATFSSAVMVGTRWKDWKTMPILAARRRARSSSSRRAEIGAQHRNAALRGALEPGDDHEQGRFAGARAAHHGDRLAGATLEVEPTQNGDGPRAGGQRHMHGFEPDGGGLRVFQGLIHGISRAPHMARTACNKEEQRGQKMKRGVLACGRCCRRGLARQRRGCMQMRQGRASR